MFDLLNNDLSITLRLAIIVAVVIVAHVAVRMVRSVSERVMARTTHHSLSKVRTVNTLITSVLVFILYFGALGWALSELGVSLTAYLASASIVGLAIGFGSQGIVQDVVTGLTVLLTDMFDVGDMVQIGTEVGIVQRLGMRFTVLQNAMNANVIIPNRSITNVINYPRGYVRIHADITLSTDPEKASRIEREAIAMTESVYEQFAGVFRAAPDVIGRLTTPSGKSYLRIKFRIWPGRGGPIEKAFKQELTRTLKSVDEKYEDWMVSVDFEVEKSAPKTMGKN